MTPGTLSSTGTTNKDYREGYREGTKEGQKQTVMQLCCSIAAFNEDPPDSPFQHGFLTALYHVLKEKI